MQRIAKFEKVSFEQFLTDWTKFFGSLDDVRSIYDDIKIPVRATKGSAGYDFFAPKDIVLEPNQTITIPTGIRVWIDEGWVLQNYPRSGLGFKYRLALNNTVGIIDSDYYYSSNQGHIMCKMTNNTNENKVVSINKGDGFCQGIFVQYGITIDDDCQQIRDGGFGSTTNK